MPSGGVHSITDLTVHSPQRAQRRGPCGRGDRPQQQAAKDPGLENTGRGSGPVPPNNSHRPCCDDHLNPPWIRPALAAANHLDLPVRWHEELLSGPFSDTYADRLLACRAAAGDAEAFYKALYRDP